MPRFILGLPLLALAVACATPASLSVANVRRPMLEDSRGKIASTEVILPIRQTEIYVYGYVPPPTNTVYYSNSGTIESAIGTALGSAIAGAMIQGQNNAIRARAEERARPIRAALAGFNFDETLQNDLKAVFSQLPWLNADGYQVLKEFRPGHPLGVPTASGRFLIAADYHLSENADELILSITPSYYYQERSGVAPAHPADRPTAGPNPGPVFWTDHLLYTNQLSFRIHAPNASDDARSNVCEWTLSEAAVVRQALALGSAKLAQMLAADLQDALPAASAAGGPEETTVGGIKGVVMARDEHGSLVNLESGAWAFLAKTSTPAYAAQPGSRSPCSAPSRRGGSTRS